MFTLTIVMNNIHIFYFISYLEVGDFDACIVANLSLEFVS